MLCLTIIRRTFLVLTVISSCHLHSPYLNTNHHHHHYHHRLSSLLSSISFSRKTMSIFPHDYSDFLLNPTMAPSSTIRSTSSQQHEYHQHPPLPSFQEFLVGSSTSSGSIWLSGPDENMMTRDEDPGVCQQPLRNNHSRISDSFFLQQSPDQSVCREVRAVSSQVRLILFLHLWLVLTTHQIISPVAHASFSVLPLHSA